MGNNVIIHLIRHEKTQSNAKRRYLGWTDESIITQRLEFDVPIAPRIVYGSDLKRCRETVKLYFPHADFVAASGLREYNFGEFEMKTYEDLKDNPLYRQWIDNPETIAPPKGENYLSFVKRVLAAFHQVVAGNGEYTFVVHGGVIRALLSIFGPGAQTFNEIAVPHRSLHSLFWSDIADVKGGERCKSLLEVPIMEKDGSSKNN